MSHKMKRVKRSWMPPITLTYLLILLTCVCSAQENYSCHISDGGLFFSKGDTSESAAIIPRGDIEVKVGGPPAEVLCIFNSSILKAEDVYFTTKTGPVDYHIYNDSAIRTMISKTKPDKYTLYCKLKRKNKKEDKRLCSQIVKAGYEPMDVTDMKCVANNNLMLNCTWNIPDNPINTKYAKPKYVVKNYQKLSTCPQTEEYPPYTYCYWSRKTRLLLRDSFDILFTAWNSFGVKNFSHHIDILQYIHPDKVFAQVSLINATRVKVTWNLTFPMDVLHSGLWHDVEYRLAGTNKWLNVTSFFHVNSYTTLATKRIFSVEKNLPYANVLYQFRVRIRNGYNKLKVIVWSPYDLLTIKTEPVVPSVAPKTGISSFETVEVLDNRDIYVYFQDIDILDHAGENFNYEVQVFSDTEMTPLDIEPFETTSAYIKYKSMNYTSYRFEITPRNEKGSAIIHSNVSVPESDCLPKKTKMFTVITKITEMGKLFSLYWVPSEYANDDCTGAGPGIDSYTIFWCKKSNGDRCRTKLFWREVTDLELIVKDLSPLTAANITIYEKNITDLDPNEIYTFGVAANNGQYSSGIRWSSCIVDDSEPPAAPETFVSYNPEVQSSATIKWSLKCNSISAVPYGFNVSYCKSNIPDFGHCLAPVEHIVVGSPSAKNVTIKHLDASYTYIVSVSVLSLIGEGRQSIPKSMELGDEIPTGPPRNIQIVSKTSTTVELSWDPPSADKRRGRIIAYRITTEPFTKVFTADPANMKRGMKKVKKLLNGLLPYTRYQILIKACTKVGCSLKSTGVLTIITKSAVPSVVKNFEVDVANWRLSWTPHRCVSMNCSYEIKTSINNTLLKTVSILNDRFLYLSDMGLKCNNTEMIFEIREIGIDENGKTLYGNWTDVKKQADLCPSDGLSWWALFLIIVMSLLVASVLIVTGRIGYGNIRSTIKDCYQTIILPSGIQAATEANKDNQRKEFPAEIMNIRRTSEPSLLLLHPDNSPVTSPIARDDSRALANITHKGLCSERLNLIDAIEGERHGRNMSGSSNHSSGQDSAVMSASPSGGDTDPENENIHLGQNQNIENTLRQRCAMPPYIQHGAMLEKLSEGYMTAHSVPSLPQLYIEGFNPSQQSTPNLNGAMHMTQWQNARRASTGYISMPDSELDSPVAHSKLPNSRNSGLPSYSRHSFVTNLKPEVKPASPIAGAQVGYTAIADICSPLPPSTGYVLTADPLKRPPSLPLIMERESFPLGAYCKFSLRENSATAPGYVIACPADNTSTPIENNNTAVTRNPYVTYGEAAMMSAGKPNNTGANPPYVELCDAGRWAQPINRVPALATAPVEMGQINRVGQMPRPNTTEATMGHRRSENGPSLSKQSSGYVSQETIHPCDSVLMSPKRLLSQSTVPHTVLMSPSHRASMV